MLGLGLQDELGGYTSVPNSPCSGSLHHHPVPPVFELSSPGPVSFISCAWGRREPPGVPVHDTGPFSVQALTCNPSLENVFCRRVVRLPPGKAYTSPCQLWGAWPTSAVFTEQVLAGHKSGKE